MGFVLGSRAAQRYYELGTADTRNHMKRNAAALLLLLLAAQQVSVACPGG